MSTLSAHFLNNKKKKSIYSCRQEKAPYLFYVSKVYAIIYLKPQFRSSWRFTSFQALKLILQFSQSDMKRKHI